MSQLPPKLGAKSASPAREASRLPEYTRIPAIGGRCSVTGMSRSTILKLIYPCAENSHKPPVRSFCLKRTGAFRGTRLISVESLIAFVESHQSDEGRAA